MTSPIIIAFVTFSLVTWEDPDSEKTIIYWEWESISNQWTIKVYKNETENIEFQKW